MRSDLHVEGVRLMQRVVRWCDHFVARHGDKFVKRGWLVQSSVVV